MQASTRDLSVAAIVGAVFGAAVTWLGYSGFAPAIYLALPGGLVDIALNTPYHASALTATAVNAPLYALIAFGIAALTKRWRSQRTAT
jgi:large-conductance mechanosensitive channel